MTTQSNKIHTEVPLVLTGIKVDAALLKAKGACSDGFSAFVQKFPDGADLQEVLHWLAEIEKPDWAKWVFANIGKASTITKIEGSLKVKFCFVAGSLSVSVGIEAGCGIEAGRGIEAGFSIVAKLTIACGLRIFAGLCGWRLPSEAEMQIHCSKLTRGEVSFGKLIEGE